MSGMLVDAFYNAPETFWILLNQFSLTRKPHTLGKGYSGELDMAIHYTRSELLEPRFLWDLHSTGPRPATVRPHSM